jgi:hypothetical protein
MSLCDHSEFIAGNVHTDFIPQHREQLFQGNKKNIIDENIICTSICSILNHENESYLNMKSMDPFIANLNRPFWTNTNKSRKIGISFDNNKTGKITDKKRDKKIKLLFLSFSSSNIG